MLALLSAFISQKNKFFFFPSSKPVKAQLNLTSRSFSLPTRRQQQLGYCESFERITHRPQPAPDRRPVLCSSKSILPDVVDDDDDFSQYSAHIQYVRTTVQGVRKKFNIRRTSTLSDHVPSALCCYPVIFSIISWMLLLCIYGKVGEMLLNSSLLFCEQKNCWKVHVVSHGNLLCASMIDNRFHLNNNNNSN